MQPDMCPIIASLMACVVSMCSWRRVYPRQVQHAEQAVRADAGDNGCPAEGQRETV